ncbi:hypothetical protein QNO07_11610 [Streptomyces sp. 549]|uniref:hypothetical protein n=1 Tax=Streptomyces sp. 549 TaxID=3049076 RepID=UPI0024C249B5|nr:hypothetical protein [Streptomyces sp. 549]MDK1474054.1 hypothetical protein [Streptomyces sp. 549]
MPRIALYALIVCVLSLVAAVLSFSRGSWLGVVWILMMGVASNIAYFYWARARMQRRAAERRAAEQRTVEPAEQRTEDVSDR